MWLLKALRYRPTIHDLSRRERSSWLLTVRCAVLAGVHNGRLDGVFCSSIAQDGALWKDTGQMSRRIQLVGQQLLCYSETKRHSRPVEPSGQATVVQAPSQGRVTRRMAAPAESGAAPP